MTGSLPPGWPGGQHDACAQLRAVPLSRNARPGRLPASPPCSTRLAAARSDLPLTSAPGPRLAPRASPCFETRRPLPCPSPTALETPPTSVSCRSPPSPGPIPRFDHFRLVDAVKTTERPRLVTSRTCRPGGVTSSSPTFRRQVPSVRAAHTSSPRSSQAGTPGGQSTQAGSFISTTRRSRAAEPSRPPGPHRPCGPSVPPATAEDRTGSSARPPDRGTARRPSAPAGGPRRPASGLEVPRLTRASALPATG